MGTSFHDIIGGMGIDRDLDGRLFGDQLSALAPRQDRLFSEGGPAALQRGYLLPEEADDPRMSARIQQSFDEVAQFGFQKELQAKLEELAGTQASFAEGGLKGFFNEQTGEVEFRGGAAVPHVPLAEASTNFLTGEQTGGEIPAVAVDDAPDEVRAKIREEVERRQRVRERAREQLAKIRGGPAPDDLERLLGQEVSGLSEKDLTKRRTVFGKSVREAANAVATALDSDFPKAQSTRAKIRLALRNAPEGTEDQVLEQVAEITGQSLDKIRALAGLTAPGGRGANAPRPGAIPADDRLAGSLGLSEDEAADLARDPALVDRVAKAAGFEDAEALRRQVRATLNRESKGDPVVAMRALQVMLDSLQKLGDAPLRVPAGGRLDALNRLAITPDIRRVFAQAPGQGVSDAEAALALRQTLAELFREFSG